MIKISYSHTILIDNINRISRLCQMPDDNIASNYLSEITKGTVITKAINTTVILHLKFSTPTIKCINIKTLIHFLEQTSLIAYWLIIKWLIDAENIRAMFRTVITYQSEWIYLDESVCLLTMSSESRTVTCVKERRRRTQLHQFYTLFVCTHSVDSSGFRNSKSLSFWVHNTSAEDLGVNEMAAIVRRQKIDENLGNWRQGLGPAHPTDTLLMTYS